MLNVFICATLSCAIRRRFSQETGLKEEICLLVAVTKNIGHRQSALFRELTSLIRHSCEYFVRFLPLVHLLMLSDK